MQFIRPKIIGTLRITTMMAGNLAVINDIRNAPNKIRIVCDSYEHGLVIIERIKQARPGELLQL